MTFILAVCVAVVFGVSIYLLLGRELKGVAMGVFLISHAANLCIIAQSGSPVPAVRADPEYAAAAFKGAPVVPMEGGATLATMVDPLPQALILTAIVIGFGVMGFLLALIVVTARQTGTLDAGELTQQAARGLANDSNDSSRGTSSPGVGRT